MVSVQGLKILYVNPNSTNAMTDSVVAAAKNAHPEARIIGSQQDDLSQTLHATQHRKLNGHPGQSIPNLLVAITSALFKSGGGLNSLSVLTLVADHER
ncbi:MAG: hypothetical protein JJ979_11225 [Roseibium sp.]|nr:hypothetical protein [Roseibium sp.]